MLALALDTTTRAGSVALVEDDHLVAERRGDPARTHGERLPAEILALLDAHDRRLDAIDLFAVASGPGSFTGLRIGIATMQGLALVGGRPLGGVSALEALASIARSDVQPGSRIGVWMDAHRREIFAALYEVAGGGSDEIGGVDGVTEIEGATVGDPAATLARWQRLGAMPALIAGDGVAPYADVIARADRGVRVAAAPPLAGAIGRIAIVRARLGAAPHPAGLQPLYIRRPDAELARDHARADRAADVAPRD
jgi:tRNA threonylcarbamoyladenosine biosynthesis protein TsaB